MKFISAACLATGLAAAALALPVEAATEVGVSVEISQPGVYGRVDIGRFPQPRVIVAQPVVVLPPQRRMAPPEPVYLWVPPGHRKDWRRHCRHYNACGVPVYFVRHDWYEQHVAPPRERGRDGWRGDRDDDRRERDGRGRGNGHGHGRGEGHGHGRGHDR